MTQTARTNNSSSNRKEGINYKRASTARISLRHLLSRSLTPWRDQQSTTSGESNGEQTTLQLLAAGNRCDWSFPLLRAGRKRRTYRLPAIDGATCDFEVARCIRTGAARECWSPACSILHSTAAQLACCSSARIQIGQGWWRVSSQYACGINIISAQRLLERF